jgi:hypothetical protein
MTKGEYMELQSLNTVNQYAKALKRVRIGIANVQGLPPGDEEGRFISEMSTPPYIYVGSDALGVPIPKQKAIDVLMEQETYLVGLLADLGVKA